MNEAIYKKSSNRLWRLCFRTCLFIDLL